MHKKPNQQKMYYFSDKLKKQLAQIPRHRLTIIEAPSGFGKTTAVKEYFKENLPNNTREYWYTCLGESASAAWGKICDLLENVHMETAMRLRKLEIPSMATLVYISSILKDLHCDDETYLVIDNYQFVSRDIPRELLDIFSMHHCPNLHLIFITQQLEQRQQFEFHNTDIHTINIAAFLFDMESTASLFRIEGIRLSDDELESVQASTEGWISAIRLQIINYEESGLFNHTADIDHLVEHAIWNRLTPAEKEFMLSVSVMGSFTVKQAAIMVGMEMLPENIILLLKTNDFIRYYPDSGIYTIHNILQNYLQNQFDQYMDENFQARMLYRAGQAYTAVSQYFNAVQCFIKIKDFDAMLSIPFDGTYFANQKEKKLIEYIVTLVNECSEEILYKYPFEMLIFAYPMLFNKQMNEFRKLCGMIDSVIKNGKELKKEDLKQLKGEFIFLKSFMEYSDIKKMNKGWKAALKILGRPSRILVKEMPWTFGSTSVLSIFWRESGRLDDILCDMDESLPYYLKLTQGHGTGAESVLRAEAMLMRGEDNEAEILCHRAIYDAHSRQQTCICICAVQVLARIAIMRGDVEGYLNAVKNVQNYAKEDSNLYIRRMVDLCTSVINFTMGITDSYAKWLYGTDSIQKTIDAPAIPYAQLLYSEFLLLEKRYHELLGISQPILTMAKDMHYMLPQVYQLIFLAIAHHNMGNNQEAMDYLKEALTLAMPDRIYLPFAQQWGELNSLLESVISLPSSNEESYTSFWGRKNLTELKALCKRQEKGANAIKKAIFHIKSPLSPREREIAQLTKERLSAKEIAEKLFISDKTVKSTLRSIYSKLEIHSRAELNLRDF